MINYDKENPRIEVEIKRFKHPKEAYRNEKNEKEALKEAKKKAKTKKEQLMSNIIIVDFRDDEDFANHPYISYLKQTLNMISYLDQVPELWKLNDFFVECVHARIIELRGNSPPNGVTDALGGQVAITPNVCRKFTGSVWNSTRITGTY